MNCPKCNTPYQCPCKACVARNPDVTPWIHETENRTSCSNCGITKSWEEWFEIESEQYKTTREVKV